MRNYIVLQTFKFYVTFEQCLLLLELKFLQRKSVLNTFYVAGTWVLGGGKQPLIRKIKFINEKGKSKERKIRKMASEDIQDQ